jgi:hypothetical protein
MLLLLLLFYDGLSFSALVLALCKLLFIRLAVVVPPYPEVQACGLWARNDSDQL